MEMITSLRLGFLRGVFLANHLASNDNSTRTTKRQNTYQRKLTIHKKGPNKQHTLCFTHSVLTAFFPGEPGLAGCPLNSPSPFIPGLRILWDRPKLSMSFLTQSHQVFFNFLRYTTFDPVIIIFSFNISKPSQPTLFHHQTDWFQS